MHSSVQNWKMKEKKKDMPISSTTHKTIRINIKPQQE